MPKETETDTVELTQEQRILRDSIADFIGKECPLEKVKEMIEAAQPYDPKLWSKMAEQEYIGMLLPESAGGMGYGPVELTIAAEEMGRASLPGPFLANLWGTGLIDRTEPTPLRDKALAQIANGEMIVSVAFEQLAENGLSAPLELKAERVDAGYRLSGPSGYILDGAVSGRVVILFRDSDGSPLLALLSMDTPGLILSKASTLDHMRPCQRLSCDDALVREADVLAPVDSGVETGTLLAGLAASAEMIGTMDWILRETSASLKKRSQMGMAVKAFEDVPAECEELILQVERCRAMLHAAAALLQESGKSAAAAVSEASRACVEAAGALRVLLLRRQEGMELSIEHDIGMFRSVPPFYGSIA